MPKRKKPADDWEASLAAWAASLAMLVPDTADFHLWAEHRWVYNIAAVRFFRVGGAWSTSPLHAPHAAGLGRLRGLQAHCSGDNPQRPEWKDDDAFEAEFGPEEGVSLCVIAAMYHRHADPAHPFGFDIAPEVSPTLDKGEVAAVQLIFTN